MSEREYRAADRRLITDFLSSETGIRLREAEKIIREFKFSILMKAAELFDTEEDDEILLQGVADCFFEERDGNREWTIRNLSISTILTLVAEPIMDGMAKVCLCRTVAL